MEFSVAAGYSLNNQFRIVITNMLILNIIEKFQVSSSRFTLLEIDYSIFSIGYFTKAILY